jgi:hypothetical protein
MPTKARSARQADRAGWRPVNAAQQNRGQALKTLDSAKQPHFAPQGFQALKTAPRSLPLRLGERLRFERRRHDKKCAPMSNLGWADMSCSIRAVPVLTFRPQGAHH